MPPSFMDGIRNFRFTVGSDILELEDTDFWLSYDAETEGTGESELSVTLNNVWQHADFSLAQGLPRRDFIEERLKELTWDFIGKRGTLEIDFGTPQAKVLDDITLIGVQASEAALNDIMEFSMAFKFPLASARGTGGIEIARKLEFHVLPANLFEFSERFNIGSRWLASAGMTVTLDTDFGPALLGAGQTGDTITDSSSVDIASIHQNVAIPDDKRTYEVSVFVKKAFSPTTFPGIRFALTDGGPEVASEWTLNHDTGLATLRSGVVSGLKRIDDLVDYWRYVFTLTNNALGNTKMEFFINASVNTDGSGGWISSAMGSAVIWGAQFGLSDPLSVQALPYVVTFGSAVTKIIVADAENFLIDRAREDRTQFKDVFRAPQVRIPSGKGNENLNVTGIKELTSGGTPTNLEKRQDAEAKVQAWTDEVGEEGILLIDAGDGAESQQQAHLTAAGGADFSLPDAVTYSLDFISRYAL